MLIVSLSSSSSAPVEIAFKTHKNWGAVLPSDELSIDGSELGLLSFFRLLDSPTADFPIVTP